MQQHDGPAGVRRAGTVPRLCSGGGFRLRTQRELLWCFSFSSCLRLFPVFWVSVSSLLRKLRLLRKPGAWCKCLVFDGVKTFLGRSLLLVCFTALGPSAVSPCWRAAARRLVVSNLDRAPKNLRFEFFSRRRHSPVSCRLPCQPDTPRRHANLWYGHSLIAETTKMRRRRRCRCCSF